MKNLRLLLIFLPFLWIACRVHQIPASKNKPGWVSLFNGKNMNNWTPKIVGFKPGENFGNTFRVENGILSTRYNAYDSFNNRFGALYYNKKFTNYRLKVEYRFVGELTPARRFGAFGMAVFNTIASRPKRLDINQPFPVCLEYNLLGGNGKDERPSGEICANGIFVEIGGKRNSSYCTPPTVKRTLPGDQWVTAEIEVRDGNITQFINGEPVISFENPRFDTANALAKRLIVGENNIVKDGYISLQSNSHPMDFRKIEIMEY